MTAIKASDVDRFVARPDPARPVVLIYGPDAGLVRERAEKLAHASVDDPADPFALTRLEGDEIAATPMRLVEEASSVPMFGGRRAIRVRPTSRNIAGAVEAVLKVALHDCRVIIEAGDLRKNAPLRALCEKAANAAALPCYADNDRDIGRLIDDEMREAGLTIAPEARAALLPLLGGDRSATRNEVQKLALYARDKGSVTLDDVAAVVADASALALDALIDAAFAGRTGDVETLLAKAALAGLTPGSIMFAAQRQVAILHKTRLVIEAGKPLGAALDSMIPPVHFSRKALVETALKAWTAARLGRAMTQLAEAAFDVRRQSSLADTLAQRAMLSIAVNARLRS